MRINVSYVRPHLMHITWKCITPVLAQSTSRGGFNAHWGGLQWVWYYTERIEVDCSGRGTTRCSSCAHFLWGRSCYRTFFWFSALLMAAGWTTKETRALASVPLPVTKAELTHPCFSSRPITTANVDVGWCPFNMHWPAVTAHQVPCVLKHIQCIQA